jgi:hypothetical protein
MEALAVKKVNEDNVSITMDRMQFYKLVRMMENLSHLYEEKIEDKQEMLHIAMKDAIKSGGWIDQYVSALNFYDVTTRIIAENEDLVFDVLPNLNSIYEKM